MERTAHLEEMVTSWGIGTIAQWHVIQDNVARITRADGRKFVLKRLGLNNEAMIRRLYFEYDVLQHVEQMGLSVAVPLFSNQGTPYVIDAGDLFRLSDWLPNEPADVHTSAERIRMYHNYGAALGRFHQALVSYNDADILRKTWQTDLQTRVLDEAVPVVLAHLNHTQLPSFQALLDEITPNMISAYANLPTQLIIWDCHPGNVAVDGFEVSGFIDCDHLSIAPKIFDLAVFLVNLLKWNVGDDHKESIWLTHFDHVIIGYETIAPLSRHERAALVYAMAGIPLVFMEFFFQGGRPESTTVERDTFGWLVRHRQEIAVQLGQTYPQAKDHGSSTGMVVHC